MTRCSRRSSQGNSITQAFQFVDTGNAELGFVALSQLHGVTAGSRWLVPQNLYSPIRQDAVLLKTGANSEAATAFLAFLKGPEARAIIEQFGYALDSERRPVAALPPDIWIAINLTIELATIATLILLVVATPLAWWLARSRAWWKEAVAAIVALPLVLPPTVLGFYLLMLLGPDGPGGAIAALWGARTLAFTFAGLVIGSVIYSMPFVVQPIRNAFDAMGDRPLEVAATLRASPRRAFWTVALPLARPGFLTGAVLGFAHTVGEFGVVLMIGGNIPGQTRVLSAAIFDFVETLRWREANLLAGGMVVFAFAVILSMMLIEKRVTRGRVNDRPAIRARIPRNARPVCTRRRIHRSGEGRHRAVRPVRMRQDHRAALPRGPSTHKTASATSAATSGRTENGAFLPTHKRPLGYVFQEASLFPHLSVRRNLLFGAPRRDGGGAEVAIAFDEVVDLLGVERLLDRSPRNLSGGERQRVAIGRALLLFAWMAFIYFQFVPRSELTSPTYWFMMQIGMVLGFIASFPANWYLVRAGVKPVM